MPLLELKADDVTTEIEGMHREALTILRTTGASIVSRKDAFGVHGYNSVLDLGEDTLSIAEADSHKFVGGCGRSGQGCKGHREAE